MLRSTWISLALAIGLAPGCERKTEDPGPNCEQIADHVAQVAAKAYPGHGDMMPGGNRKAYVLQCQARKMNGKQRRCMMKAQSIEAMAECMPKEAPAERKPQGAKGMPTPPTATPPAATPPAATPPAPAAPPPTPQ
jgi:hypothetical protein